MIPLLKAGLQAGSQRLLSGNFGPAPQALRLIADGADVLLDHLQGHAVALGGADGMSEILPDRVLIERVGREQGRIGFVGHNIFLGKGGREMIPVAPGAAGDLADVGHTVDHVQAVIQTVAAAVIDRSEIREYPLHVGNFELSRYGRGDRREQLGQTEPPSVIGSRAVRVTGLRGKVVGKRMRAVADVPDAWYLQQE